MAAKRRKYSTPTPTALESLRALRTGGMPRPPSQKKNPVVSELLKHMPATRLRLKDMARLKKRRRRG